jgi:ABC-type nitrate/sulfonate/bicarbonate transport system substrate-binding protein
MDWRNFIAILPGPSPGNFTGFRRQCHGFMLICGKTMLVSCTCQTRPQTRRGKVAKGGNMFVQRRGILSAALMVCAVALVRPAAAEMQKLTFGDVSAVAPSWPMMIAEKNGYFADENLAVDTIYTGNNVAVVQQVVGGSLDIGDTTFETALRAVNGGAPIALTASEMLKYPYSVMVAAEIRAPADLAGKRIILPFQKSPLTAFWNKWTAEHGLAADSVEQVYDGATPHRFAALLSGTAQAAALTQPFDLMAENRGYRKLLDYASYAHGLGFTAFVARRDWLAAHGAAMKAYLRAVSRAVKFFYDPANRQASIDVLIAAAKVEPATAALVYDYYAQTFKPFDPKLALPDRNIVEGLAEIAAAGDLPPGDHPVANYVDRRYLPE